MTTAATAEAERTPEPPAELRPAAPPGVPEIVRQRLKTLDNWLNPYSWMVTGVIVVIAAILRINGLGDPKGYIFDEVYYPTDAWDMLQHGVEWDEKSNGPAYVVHPPLGKWLIALGEKVYGNHEFGWRISAAMVIDRDHYRKRWLRALEDGFDPGSTPRIPRIVPWWLLVSGVMFGLACGVKWSALFFAPFFAALVIVWRVQARRSAGVRGPVLAGIIGDLGWLILSFVLSIIFYLATWTGWFVTNDGYFRHYREANGLSEPPILGALLNLMHYHSEAYRFHSGLTEKHIYQSWPWQWLLLGRPVAFYWNNSGNCGAPSCAREILLLGTPILWWSFLPALVALVWFGIARRDWRAWAIGTGAVAGLLPWFYFAVKDGRTMFSFYALPALPFLILAVVYVLGAIMTPPDGLEKGEKRTDRQLIGMVVATAYVVLVAVCFAYFYPIFVGQIIPYDDWSARMWLGGRWI